VGLSLFRCPISGADWEPILGENTEGEGTPSGSSAMGEGADLGHDPAQGLSTQGDGQSAPSEAPDGPKAADDSIPADEPQESVWDKVLRHRHMPSPVKRFAEHRLNMAHAEEWRQSASRRDPAQNAATRLPPGEQAQVPVRWLAEIFTPTTIDGLIEGIRQLAGKPTGPYSTDSDDLIEWIRSSRREGFTAYKRMSIIAPKGSRIMNRIEDEVPSGISYVNPCLYTLTSTVTVMVASFRLQDDRASGLETILNQDMTTKIEWSGRAKRARHEGQRWLIRHTRFNSTVPSSPLSIAGSRPPRQWHLCGAVAPRSATPTIDPTSTSK
jgi:hypothetical protein